MRRDDSINRAFDFLTEHARNGMPFSLGELSNATGWTAKNTKTNLGKRLKDVVQKKEEKFYAKPEILRVRLEDFKDLFRQKQRLFTDYFLKVTPSVLVYEFFMPLSREDRLREALDNLFYLDTVEQRIREIGITQIRQGLKLPGSCSDEEIRRLVIDFVENTIGGYSLYLVNGRFRASSLATREKVVARPFAYGPYIVDETTAVVRFILPVDTGQKPPVQMSLFEPAQMATDTTERSEQMRWLFLNFFAEVVTHVVRKEDEIWLLETGMRSALYRWVRPDE